MRRLLREPLLHFLVLGALLFAGYGLLHGRKAPAPQQILVSQGQIASLLEGFARSRQRAPTPDELAGLIRDRVRQEVYYREALVLGLDKDDAIIRRRLQQKMEFISDDVAAQATPADAELNAYLQAHPDAFRLESRLSFRQLYLDPQKHGANLGRDATQLLEQLRAHDPAAVSVTGDPLMLGHTFSDAPRSEIKNAFGEVFAAKLDTLALRQWQGPVESSYGMHLVFISERSQGQVPALADVREAVRRAWDEARRQDANERFYQELLRHYTVTVEAPQPVAEPSKLAAVR